jgi:hypothetical protein
MNYLRDVKNYPRDVRKLHHGNFDDKAKASLYIYEIYYSPYEDEDEDVYHEGIDDVKKNIEVIKDQIMIISGIKRNRKRNADGDYKLNYIQKERDNEDIEYDLKFYTELLKLYEGVVENFAERERVDKEKPKFDEELKVLNKKFEENLREKLEDLINDKVDLYIHYGIHPCRNTDLDGVYISYDYINEDKSKTSVSFHKDINKGPVVEFSMPFVFSGGEEKNDSTKILSRVQKILTIDNWYRIENT